MKTLLSLLYSFIVFELFLAIDTIFGFSIKLAIYLEQTIQLGLYRISLWISTLS